MSAPRDLTLEIIQPNTNLLPQPVDLSTEEGKQLLIANDRIATLQQIVTQLMNKIQGQGFLNNSYKYSYGSSVSQITKLNAEIKKLKAELEQASNDNEAQREIAALQLALNNQKSLNATLNKRNRILIDGLNAKIDECEALKKQKTTHDENVTTNISLKRG